MEEWKNGRMEAFQCTTHNLDTPTAQHSGRLCLMRVHVCVMEAQRLYANRQRNRQSTAEILRLVEHSDVPHPSLTDFQYGAVIVQGLWHLQSIGLSEFMSYVKSFWSVPPTRSTVPLRCPAALIRTASLKSSPSFNAQISIATAVKASVIMARALSPSTRSTLPALEGTSGSSSANVYNNIVEKNPNLSQKYIER